MQDPISIAECSAEISRLNVKAIHGPLTPNEEMRLRHLFQVEIDLYEPIFGTAEAARLHCTSFPWSSNT